MKPLFPSTVQRARTFVRHRPAVSSGIFELSRFQGRVVEVSQPGYFGALSALTGLLTQVQGLGEQIGWVSTGSSVFYPPDLEYRGVDTAAVSVVFAPDAPGGLLAADWLLRSGAFGLVVVDWAGGAVDDSDLGRLSRLTADRGSVLVFLTQKQPGEPSLSSQVSLRVAGGPASDGESEWEVVKDKLSGPATKQRMRFHGPFGLY